MRFKKKKPVAETVEKYIRTYYSLLRSSGDVQLRALEDKHAEIESNLHRKADLPDIDISALLYSSVRLPDCMDNVRRIVLGQSEEVFQKGGFSTVFQWQRVSVPARRREVFFDGKETLAVFISSVSDIDDLVPSLAAFQIEWNKMHERLNETVLGNDLADSKVEAESVGDDLQKLFGCSREDWELLQNFWQKNWNQKFARIALGPKNIRLNLLAGGFSDYRRAVQDWWNELIRHLGETLIEFRPVYFVSSNTHSIANLLSGFALQQRDNIIASVMEKDAEGLHRYWRRLHMDGEEGPQMNFLYYGLRHFLERDRQNLTLLQAAEEGQGILRQEHFPFLNLEAQIIDLRKINIEKLDPRLSGIEAEALSQSRALILNVDYPLGFTAYHLLSQILSSVRELRGIFVMGKAATMNGRVGDIMIPDIIYDIASHNQFFFRNCFSARDLLDYVYEAAVFDNQKSLTVRGTFLQNQDIMTDFHRQDYNGIEMEAGPYLCAIYENIYPERYPLSTSINLQKEQSCDIGILHYASDTPYSKRESLLSKRMGLDGIEATYACSVAILRRILEKETGKF